MDSLTGKFDGLKVSPTREFDIKCCSLKFLVNFAFRFSAVAFSQFQVGAVALNCSHDSIPTGPGVETACTPWRPQRFLSMY